LLEQPKKKRQKNVKTCLHSGRKNKAKRQQANFSVLRFFAFSPDLFLPEYAKTDFPSAHFLPTPNTKKPNASTRPLTNVPLAPMEHKENQHPFWRAILDGPPKQPPLACPERTRESCHETGHVSRHR